VLVAVPIFTDQLQSTRWLLILLTLVTLDSTNRGLTRLVRNHGWRAVRPVWSFTKEEFDVATIPLLAGLAGSPAAWWRSYGIAATDNITVLEMSLPAIL
jgi:hypothetical protein